MSAGLPCRSSVGQSIENSGCDRLNQFRCPGNRTRQRTHEVRCARGLGQQLQRCANCARHLSNAIFRQQRIGPTSEPSGVRATVVSRLDGRSAEAAPRRAARTFWDYERARWTANKGMRLDHFLLSPTMLDPLVDGGVDRGVRGEENASDHAPAWIVVIFDIVLTPLHGECSFAAARPSQAE